MKRIVSMIAVIAMLMTMCSFTVSADYASTLNTTASSDKVSQGEQVVVHTRATTTNGMATVGFKVAFDLDDMEPGVSPLAAAAAEEYADLIGTDDFPTLDAVTESLYKRAAHVDDEYHDGYKALDDKYKFDALQLSYEEKDGIGYIYFGYASDTAKNALNKLDNMLLGGAVLKVKTAEKKQTTISIVQATASGSDGIDTPCTLEPATITLNLNGYGEVVEPEVPTAESIGLWTGGVAKLTNQEVTNSENETYKVDTGLAFLSCVKTTAGATDLKTVITCADRDGELPIEAGDKVYVNEDDGYTYFAAAVTSIRKENLNKAFTAKAVVTVDGNVITGTGATATYAE